MRRLAMAMAIVALVWPAASMAGDNDQRVADTLARNLKASEVLKGFQIQVQYREGTARLEGWVRNKQQADEAVAIANRTPEVERVINHLEVKGDATAAAPLVLPASVVKPQHLPPAPETMPSGVAGPAMDQPVLRSALRSPRSSAGQPGEFKPSTPNAGPPTTELMVGQRLPQARALGSVASVSPRTLPMQGSTLDRPAPMPPSEEPPQVIPPKTMPIAPANVQRPGAGAKPMNVASDSGWGRTGAASASQAQYVPRRPQPTPMPMIYPQQRPQQQGYSQQASYPQQAYSPQQAYAQGYPMQYQTAAYPQPVPMNGGPMPMPVPAHVPGVGGGAAPAMYDQPNLPNYAWPTYAAYPNYAALTYPKQYSPTAWPYIGPFYPYPQVPLGWRKVTLEWDDGWWFLDFSDDRRHGCR